MTQHTPGGIAPRIETTTAAKPAAFQAFQRIVAEALLHPDDQRLVLAPDPALQAEPTARLTLAYRGQEAIGCIASFRDRNGCLTWLTTLVVARTARGQGIGKRLVAEAVADCDARAWVPPVIAATIRILEDGTPNHASAAAFLAAGFVVASRLRPRIVDIGPRGAALWDSAADDGSILQALAIRVPAGGGL